MRPRCYPRLRTCIPLTASPKAAPERFPLGGTHPSDKNSLQINMLEHVLFAKPRHSFAEHAPARMSFFRRAYAEGEAKAC